MSDDHTEAVEELRLLGAAMAEKMEPLLRLVTESTTAENPNGSCDRCPICLLVAMIRGEQPELVLQLASKFSAMVFAVQEAFEPKKDAARGDSTTRDGAQTPGDGETSPEESAPQKSRYEPIEIRLIS